MSSLSGLNKKAFWTLGWSLVLGVSAHTGIALALDSAPTQAVEGRAPVASAVVLVNDTRPGERGAEGDTLSVDYNFADADGDTEVTTGANATSFVWKRDGTAIGGATDATYSIVAADAGSVLTAEVTPKTDPLITDPEVGLAAASSPMTIGESTQPTAIEIHNSGGLLTGRPVVDDVLTAQPICPGTCDTNMVFTWKVDGADVGNGTTYTPTKDDQKKVITVSTPTVL